MRGWLNKKALTVLVVSAASLSGCAAAAVGGIGAAGYTASQERTAGTIVDDASILFKVKNKHAQEGVAHLFNRINVDVHDGRVLLKGVVVHPDHRVEAVRLAWEVEGVKEVINEIQVDGKLQTPEQIIKDEWIVTQIDGKLLVAQGVSSMNFNVDCVNNIVYIIGIAKDREELGKVLDIARRVNNVERVVSHVRIANEIPAEK